ncbi:MAG: hypothetical protein ABRQ38_30600 [Candidatus Eremiobacterota bacterium]
MKYSYINLSFMFIIFITLNIINRPVSGETINSLPAQRYEIGRESGEYKKEEHRDVAYSSRSYNRRRNNNVWETGNRRKNNNGWKAGEGNKDNLYRGPVYKKGKIPDNSGTVTTGCFVTFIGIPVGLIILYIIFEYLKNTGKKTSNTTYYYDENGKIDRMSEE